MQCTLNGYLRVEIIYGTYTQFMLIASSKRSIGQSKTSSKCIKTYYPIIYKYYKDDECNHQSKILAMYFSNLIHTICCSNYYNIAVIKKTLDFYWNFNQHFECQVTFLICSGNFEYIASMRTVLFCHLVLISF